MKTKTTKQSPAMTLIRHVAEHEGGCNGKSWDRTNHARLDAVSMAIEYGLRFDPDDGAAVWSICSRLSNWESWYASACGKDRGRDNRTAVAMIEKLLGRTGFLVRHEPEDGSPARIYVGCRFKWYGQMVTVTSFNDKNKTFTACTYKKRPDSTQCEKCGQWKHYSGCEKIDKRFTISHDDIRDYHAALKLEAELGAEAGKLTKDAKGILTETAKSKFGERWALHRLTLKDLEWVRAKIEELRGVV